MSVILVFCQQHKRGWAVKTHKRSCITKLRCQTIDDKLCRVSAIARLTINRKGKVKEEIYVDGFELTYTHKILFNTIIVDKHGKEINIPWLKDYLNIT